MTTLEPTAERDEPATSYAAADEGPLADAGALLLFDGPLERADLLRAVAAGVQACPALRLRPVRLPLAAELLSWSPDPGFRPRCHVRTLDAGDPPAVARVVSALWSRPLPGGRPPWQVDLLTGPDDTGAAVVVRGHAGLVQDANGAALAAALLGATEQAPPAPRTRPGDDATHGTALLPALLQAAATLAERGARSSRVLAAEVRGLLRPGVALARTRELGRALESAGTLLSSPAPETPWNRPLRNERSVAWLSLELGGLRGVARSIGGDWHDAWLTVVADALGRVLRARGRDTTGLTLLAYVPAAPSVAGEVPVSPLLVGLPVAEMPPAARAGAVRSSRRDSVAASRGAGLAQLAGVSDRLPEPLKSLLGSLCYQAANVVVATHAAPGEPIVVAGRTASLVVPLAPLPWHVGLALRALVRDGEIVVGVTVDAAALPAADDVARALRDAYRELASACRPCAGTGSDG